MSRALLAFLLRCWLVVFIQALCLGQLFLWHLHDRLPITSILLVVLALVASRAFFGWFAAGQFRPSPWLWRLSRRVVGFRTVSNERVSLLFPAGFDGAIKLHELIQWSESDLDDLSQRFGIRLRRRLNVVLISSHRDITADFGRPMGGTALVAATAVVLAADCPLRQCLRHELAHLFAARWNLDPPPLVQEGLAVWLERTEPDQTDTDRDPFLVSRFDADPSPLLDPRYFFSSDRVHASYALAGAFTGFLIRRFGWDHYRGFYRKAECWTFRSVFQRHFGMRLEEAWRRCHEESVAMASLNRRLREDPLFNPLV